jgi:hypothetical protein
MAITQQAKVTGVQNTEEMNQVIKIAEKCSFTRMSIDYSARSFTISLEVMWDLEEYDDEETHDDLANFDITVADLGYDVQWSEI